MADKDSGGGFFGGVSSGWGDAQNEQLAQQKQDALEENQRKVLAQTQIDKTLNHIKEVAQAAAAAGNNPSKIYGAIEPLIQSAQGLAQTAGLDPNYVPKMAQLITMQPASPDQSHKVITIPGTMGEPPTVLRVEQNSGTVTPLDPRTGQPMGNAPATGQPNLSNSEVITPSQVTAANPGMQPPAQSAPTTPIQQGNAPATFSQRFAAADGTASDAQRPALVPAIPPDMQPGLPTINYAIKNNITGREFLKAVPAPFTNTVTGLADYKINPDKLSKRVDKDGQSEYTRMLSWAHQFDTDYDPKYYGPMQKALTEFTSGGRSSPAGQITAGNTAIQHVGEMADAFEKMQTVPGLLEKIAKSDTSVASYAASRLKNAAVRGTSEGAALAAFMDARERYTSEIETFYAGGKGADAAIQRSQHALDGAYSPKEMYAVLNKEVDLLNGKVNALQDRWKISQAGPRFGDALFRNALPDFPIIQDKSQKTILRIRALSAAEDKSVSNPGNVVDFRTYFGTKSGNVVDFGTYFGTK